jgi:magnesium-transporting ATPase (P-type)
VNGTLGPPEPPLAGPVGLTTLEATARRQLHGRNVVAEGRRRPLALQLLLRFRNPLVLLLLGSATVSGATGDVRSAVVIGLMVLLSVVLDFVQEHRAGRAAERLREAVLMRATVVRDGEPRDLPAAEIVPGDVVVLSAGDLVPADGHLLEARDLFVNQALLTGEPYPIEKHARGRKALGADDEAPRHNFLYDLSEIPVPTDLVDEEYVRRPHRWDMRFIRRYMLVPGPVSSLFDLLTFFVLYRVLGAGAALFHTGWFMESLATQVLVIFVIRTRHNPFRSRPSAPLALTALLVVGAAVLLPLTRAGAALGFVRPPLVFFPVLAATVIAYLGAAELAKRWFYAHIDPDRPRRA